MTGLVVLAAVLTGTLVSCALACLPALHVYNVLGLLVMLMAALAAHGIHLPSEVLVGPGQKLELGTGEKGLVMESMMPRHWHRLMLALPSAPARMSPWQRLQSHSSVGIYGELREPSA